MYVCIYVYMYVCIISIYLSIYIYIYIHTHTHIHIYVYVYVLGDLKEARSRGWYRGGRLGEQAGGTQGPGAHGQDAGLGTDARASRLHAACQARAQGAGARAGLCGVGGCGLHTLQM